MNYPASVNRDSRLVDRFAVVLVAVAAMLWGTDTLFRIPLLSHLSSDRLLQSTQVVFMEHLVLTISVLPVLWFARSEIMRLNAREWTAIVAIGVGASALATVLFTISFGFNHFIETLLLQKTQPLFAILLATLWLRERLPIQAYLLIPVAIVGAYLITIPDPMHPQNAWADFHVAAALLALGASALWGAGTVFGRYALARVSYWTLTSLRFATGFPALAIVLVSLGGFAAFQGYRASDIGLYVGLAWVPGLVAMLLYYRGLTSTPATMATLAELAFPITGVLLNLYLYPKQSALDGYQIAGIVILWAAILGLDYFNARKPARLERGAASLSGGRVPSAL